MTWLESASDLLSGPDPGPTPFLVDRLVVHPSVLAIVGPPKVGKTWTLLDLALSVATGTPALGRFAVEPGPVILILEESGRAALHRRLAQLCQGRGLATDQIGDLHFAANRRVSLVDDGSVNAWPSRIREAVDRIEPVAIFFDPLARMKGTLNEDSQHEMAAALEFLRELRDLGDCTVGFVHHEGHAGRGRMRGTSDLEAFWESKLRITRTKQGLKMMAEHREDGPEADLGYRIEFAADTVRLVVDIRGEDAANERRAGVLAYLTEHPGASAEEVRKGVAGRNAVISSLLSELQAAGTVYSSPSRYKDTAGRERQRMGLHLNTDAASSPVHQGGTGRDGPPIVALPAPPSPPLKGGTGTGSGKEGPGP